MTKILTKIIVLPIVFFLFSLFISSAIKTGNPVNIAFAYAITILIIVSFILKFANIQVLRALPLIMVLSSLPFLIVNKWLAILPITTLLLSKPGRTLLHNIKVLFVSIISKLIGGKYGDVEEHQ